MTAKVKKSYTFDADVIAGVEEFAEANASAFVNDAVRRDIERRRMEQLLHELAQEAGPVGDKAHAWAKTKMNEAAKKRKDARSK